VRFFADANIPPKAVKLLNVFDPKHEGEALTSSFDQGTADPDWMRDIAKRNPKPFVLCGDGRILTNEVERQVLRDCDLMFVCLTRGWTNLPWNTFAWKIIKVWPVIVSTVGKARRPSIFRVCVQTLKVERTGLVADLPKKR